MATATATEGRIAAQQAQLRGYVAAAARAAAATPVAQGAAALATPAARAAAAAQIMAYLLAHLRSRGAAEAAQLQAVLSHALMPGEPPLEATGLDDLLSLVEARARQYPENAARRVAAALPAALALAEPERSQAVEAILKREARNEALHIEAQFARLSAGLNRLRVRAASPQGAYWRLGLRRVHCPACLAMAGAFWPWGVLEQCRPPVHFGCGCRLLGLDEALEAGLMSPADIRPSAVAHAAAARAIALANRMPGRLHEALCRHGLIDDSDLYEALAWSQPDELVLCS